MLVFFNKCEILRHAREHSDHGEVMQFNGANLLPIPLSLCHRRSKEQFLAASNDDERSVEIDGKKTSACAVVGFSVFCALLSTFNTVCVFLH